MENVHIPLEAITDELRLPCEQTLRRANELKKVEPVVAYWCSFAAAQKALSTPNRSADGTKFLMLLLDSLEEMKALLATNEAVTNEAVGSAYMENFALKVFLSADQEDRAGITGKGTIRKFVVAGQFIEVLRCFEGGLTEEMEQKLQYARWKASDHAKALREGRKPVPGPPIPETEEDELAALDLPSVPGGSREGSFSSQQRPALSPGALSPPANAPGSLSPVGNTSRQGSFSSQQRPTPPAIPSPQRPTPPMVPSPHRSPPPALPPLGRNLSDSASWSTQATPGVLDDEDAKQLGSPAKSPPAATSPPLARSPPSQSRSPEPKSVRFMGPDGAPLSPAETFATPDIFPEAPPPPPSVASIRSPPKASVPPPSLPRAAAPAPATRSQGLGLSTAPPAPQVPVQVPQPTGPARTLTRKETETVQKHAKWAISALEFDDVETARNELLKALALLS
ncbi:Vacuolar protein sorting-associated protein VTA1 [Vanrija pseudolonga]|uniref:Vacuolar protein sorting-associated protein VTA1 n=1 Tax=Vanrija pseudolonga TaxID=143232 RepID=A0AAF1BTL7_9TREE|nr:Vacuolar protein sorting-associated protein VTA1 [Vanrija pseudolonga]